MKLLLCINGLAMLKVHMIASAIYWSTAECQQAVFVNILIPIRVAYKLLERLLLQRWFDSRSGQITD